MKQPDVPPQNRGNAGMWATISLAVLTGWGPTFRLLAILGLCGAIAIGLALAR